MNPKWCTHIKLVLFLFSLYYIFSGILITLVFSFLSVLDNFFNLNINLLDIFNRVNNVDSLINSFNFLWTSSTYLSLLYLFFILVKLLSSKNIVQPLYLIMPLSLGFYLFYLLSTLLSSTVSYDSSVLYLSEINLLLLNNLNKYHPFLLYLSALQSIWLGITTFELGFTNQRLFITRLVRNSLIWTYWTLWLSMLALSLGGWWALQEGTWGGWWNWDSSEVLGLVITLICLTLLHKVVHRFTFLNIIKLIHFMLLLLMGSYFLVQLSFELTTHNFGNKFSGFFNANMLLLEGVFVVTLLGWWILRWVLRSQTLVLVLYSNPVKFYYPYTVFFRVLSTLLPPLVILSFIFISFMPLFNYFLWNFLNINTLNYPTSVFTLSFISFTLSANYFSNFKYTFYLAIAPLSALYINHFLITPLFFIVSLPTLLLSSHYTLLLFAALNIISTYFSLGYWQLGSSYQPLFTSSESLLQTHVLYSLNNTFVDQVTLFSNTSLQIPTFNTIYKSTNSKLGNLLLVTSCDELSNLFYNHIGWTTTTFYNEDIIGMRMCSLFSLFMLLLLGIISGRILPRMLYF